MLHCGKVRWRKIPTRKKALRAPLLAGIAVLALIALVAALLNLHGGSSAVRTRGATARPPATATPVGGLPAGWTTAPLGYISPDAVPFEVAVAPSDPDTVYACLYVDNPGQEPPGVYLSVSHDAGASWTSTFAPLDLQTDSCRMAVAPTNPADVVLPDELARSLDGGAHWQPLPMAGRGVAVVGWVDSSLYVEYGTCDPTMGGSINCVVPSPIYVSRNGGPFTDLDRQGTLGGIAVPALACCAGGLVTGRGSTILIAGGTTGLLSTDGGQTWRTVTFADSGGSVFLRTTSPDGQTLIGYEQGGSDVLALSHDWGHTWQALPAVLPIGLSGNTGNESFQMTPDGSLFAADSRGGSDLYMLAPGAQQWAVALHLPTGIIPYAVAWDASGHPTQLWAAYGFEGLSYVQYTIVSHALAPRQRGGRCVGARPGARLMGRVRVDARAGGGAGAQGGAVRLVTLRSYLRCPSVSVEL
jgi:hypothetical protein